MARRIEITYSRSAIGRLPQQRRTIEALGLKKLHHSVYQDDTPTIRGMLATVQHLVTCREIEEGDK